MNTMTLTEFKATLAHADPPAGIKPALVALWHDAKDDWDAAHEAAQAIDGADGAWVHAYLHRKEGDLSNADYWYRRAGRRRPEGALEAEWEAIAAALLERGR